MQFFIDGKKFSIQDLYEGYRSNQDIDDFSDWVFAAVKQGNMSCEISKRISRKEFANTRKGNRKNKIHERLISSHMSTFQGKSKKKKKAYRNEYTASEKFSNDCKEAYEKDSVLKQLEDEKYVEKLYLEYLKDQEERDLKKLRIKLEDFCDRKRLEILPDLISPNIFFDYEDELKSLIMKEVGDCLCTKVCVSCYESVGYFDDYYRLKVIPVEEVSEDDLEAYIEIFMDDTEKVVASLIDEGEEYLWNYILEFFFRSIPVLSKLKNKTEWISAFQDEYDSEISDLIFELTDHDKMSEMFVLKNLMQNPHYEKVARSFYEQKRKEMDPSYFSKKELDEIKRKEKERKKLIGRSILSSIPKEYKDLYPLARQKKRKFILHIGPTNSGKTYHAMKALRECGSGIYLAPLRLLAYEQFENLNKDGYICNLVTGEEKTIVPFATYQSSTIEMADFGTAYQMAVIDEAQMLSDEDRGGAWTAAILGLCAEEIHICAAPYAKDILIRLINECGDEYEIMMHERDTKLTFEKAYFQFPEDVKEKDALIVFSKRNVHGVASELQRKGKKCSIIYGNLPYDVRQEEARKFLDGETEILVSTDAIGMGMNLPIRRIIFLETTKFDGKSRRNLKAEEIQQIAGRAGRRGMYEIGFVNAGENKRMIKNELDAEVPSIINAVLTFPESLLGIDASLSETLERWNNLSSNVGYEKANIEEQIVLCKQLEAYTDNKRLIYDFITIPFESNNDRLKTIWLTLFKDEMQERDFNYKRFLPEVYEDSKYEYLNVLEEDYKVCDLLYFYMDRFHRTEEYGDIVELKKKISAQIMKILSKQKLVSKKCRECHTTLPWNHPYPTCERCFRRRKESKPWMYW